MKPDEPNALGELGERIFLDRYALKDMDKSHVAPGDTVVVCVDVETGQREIGVVTGVSGAAATVALDGGETVERALEHVDRPLELHPDALQARVARGIAAVEPEARRSEWAARFEWLLRDWRFVPGGRILTAAGTDQDLTFYNCYVIPSPRDSREGIFSTLGQMAEIMSRGGGVGINLSSLRPRYAYVRGVNGRSSGAVSWGSVYSFVTGLIEQGGSRRGALMLILDVWHPDVSEFIAAKRTAGRITNANISVAIPDAFMRAVEADAAWDLVFPDTGDPAYDTEWTGDLAAWRAAGRAVVVHKTVRAREVWDTIIESAWASAEPGVWFSERSNRMSNSWYFAPLVCTNPCVTGETRISTSDGLVRADDLAARGAAVSITVDGRRGAAPGPRPASPVFATGVKPVFRLSTVQGYSLRATADHRVMTDRGWREMGALAPGDRVHIVNRQGGFGREGSLDLGRILGWLVGDGTIKRSQAVLSFFGPEKAELAPAFADAVSRLVRPSSGRPTTVGVVDVRGRDEARMTSTRLFELAGAHGLVAAKHRVPESVFRGTCAMQRGFLQALFTADGSVQGGGVKGASVRLSASFEGLLRDVQCLLLNHGVACRLHLNRRRAGMRALPDGRGGHRPYACRAQHELVISRANLVAFADAIGFLDARRSERLASIVARYTRGPYREPFLATVAEVVADGEEMVYDLTEPETHSFCAGGIVVHNCGEQPLPAWSVCNLGALNLARFATPAGEVDWAELERAVGYAVRFLDDVIDATPYHFAENEAQQKSERRVGLGTMGLADLMVRCGVRYGSAAGNAFCDALFAFIARAAYLASADIAQEKGSFPRFEAERLLESGYMQGMPEEVRAAVRAQGLRNVTLLTQAPTGTTGTMVNTSTGIEPFFSWSFYRKSRLGWHEESVAVVDEWRAAHPGQADLPAHFVTAMDLTLLEHVGTQAAIQRWIDSAISKTCNVPHEYTDRSDARTLYEEMYRLGCKGGTIYRDGSRNEQVLHLKDDAEVAAEAEEGEERGIPCPPHDGRGDVGDEGHGASAAGGGSAATGASTWPTPTSSAGGRARPSAGWCG
ncbi:MAG: LAGLIDADG family homing endonuclease [Candidatus Binatia bacterium]